MSLFDRFHRRRGRASKGEGPQEQADEDDFVVAVLVPSEVPKNAEILRRQREEELRRKYCNPSAKTGDVV